jgi:hypothetical protein
LYNKGVPCTPSSLISLAGSFKLFWLGRIVHGGRQRYRFLSELPEIKYFSELDKLRKAKMTGNVLPLCLVGS